jgi:hypothetical protein
MTAVEASRLLSFGMLVLIWLVQLVIYPAFGAVGVERFADWHAGYTRRVAWVVGPLMLGQAGAIGRLLWVRLSVCGLLAAAAVAVAWVATAAWAVPLHDRLQARGAEGALVAKLVRGNWVRTVAWTLAFVALLGA